MSDKYQRLQQLKSLLDSGVLSQEEFDAEKKKILDAKEAPSKPKKKPGFFSAEAIRQREQEFENLPQAEKIHRWGAAGGFLIVFLIFFAVSLFIIMMFGWQGYEVAIRNLWGR